MNIKRKHSALFSSFLKLPLSLSREKEMKRCRELSREVQSVNMAHILMLLSQNGNNSVQYYRPVREVEEEDRVFECKTCNRQFSSFQALGGHRASHKKPKLVSSELNDSNLGALTKRKLHECSICGLEFSIGQALGGHMRRHRANNESFHFLAFNNGEDQKENINNNSKVLLDLNMPPLMEAEMESKSDAELVTLQFL